MHPHICCCTALNVRCLYISYLYLVVYIHFVSAPVLWIFCVLSVTMLQHSSCNDCYIAIKRWTICWLSKQLHYVMSINQLTAVRRYCATLVSRSLLQELCMTWILYPWLLSQTSKREIDESSCFRAVEICMVVLAPTSMTLNFSFTHRRPFA